MKAAQVVIVGGGLAGMAAALRASERGVSVAVLEQGEDERYICNSRMAMGFFTVAGLDSRSEPERLLAAITSATDGHCDAALARRLALDSRAALAWLMSQGIRFIQFGAPPNRRPVLTPLVPLQAGLHCSGRGADVMLRRLEARLVALGGRVLRGWRAEALQMSGESCTGVVVRTGSSTCRLATAAVILADGGFQADADLLQRFVTRHPAALLQRNAGTGKGDGLRMAEEAGAEIVGTGLFYGHVQSRDALRAPGELWPYPVIDIPLSAGLAADAQGRRFADEGAGGIFMANAIARLDDPLGAVAIFDDVIWNGPAKSLIVPPNPHLDGRGTILRRDTVADLATAANLPSTTLAETIAAHNSALQSGRLNGLGPPRTAGTIAPLPIQKPPFYAVPVCAGITYTMGGIAIDERCRVRRRNGGTLRGLFAAGSTTGGHEGGPRAGYTGGLMKALVFGLRAGDEAALRLLERAAE